MGADPVAFGVAAVAATRGRRLRSFSVRKEAKDHGVTGRLAGALQPGDRVVITEDTVTRGTSLMEAVDVVRGLGAEPVLITVIVDRGGTVCGAGRGGRDPVPAVADRARPRLRLRHVTAHDACNTPGLSSPAGSSARLTAAAAASSAGVRTRCSHRDLAMPTPCSAEIVPPSEAAAVSTSAVIASTSPGSSTLRWTLPSARWPNGTSRPPCRSTAPGPAQRARRARRPAPPRRA